MMKSLKVTIGLILIILVVRCKKQDTFPKAPSPSWNVDSIRSYPGSMTAVVQLPVTLLLNKQPNDKLGAFINGECRGIGENIQLNDTASVYFVMIHGGYSDHYNILFKYYSAHASRIYQTTAFLTFTADGSYGTIDSPAVLDLKAAK